MSRPVAPAGKVLLAARDEESFVEAGDAIAALLPASSATSPATVYPDPVVAPGSVETTGDVPAGLSAAPVVEVAVPADALLPVVFVGSLATAYADPVVLGALGATTVSVPGKLRVAPVAEVEGEPACAC